MRGRSVAAIGEVVSLLVLLKGLPGSYQRDLQEDKPPVWRTSRALRQSVAALYFDAERMRAALSDDILATEAADLLVARGLPFRRAHHLVAAVVAEGSRCGVSLTALARAPNFAPPATLTADDLRQLDVTTAIERRQTADDRRPAARPAMPSNSSWPKPARPWQTGWPSGSLADDPLRVDARRWTQLRRQTLWGAAG